MSAPAFLRPLAQWDGGQYVEIAANGYHGYLPVWFPLYPLLMRIVTTGHAQWLLAAGLAVNLVAGAVAVGLLARLIELDHPGAAWPTVVILLLYPGALFLSMAYTEALTLLLFVLAAYAARRQSWWLAGGMGALAALTRPTGIVIMVLLAIEYALAQRPWRLIHLPALAAPLAGPAAYAGYLWYAVADPLAFLHEQAHFHHGVGVLPDEFSSAGEFLTSSSVWVFMVALTLSLWAIRALRPSYGAFAAALVLAGPLTGTLVSSIRYVAIAWPVFAVAGCYLRSERHLMLVGAVFALGLAFFAILFTHGYWVS